MPNVVKSEKLKSMFSISLNKLVLLLFLLVIIYFGYGRYTLHKIEQAEASVFILSPQLNDIYFLDLTTLKSDKNELKNKYQLAKVIRISDDNVVVVYGNYFYQWQYSVVNSIKYGDLTNHTYFKTIPGYITFNEIKEMRKNGSIYLVKRPISKHLYGAKVSHY